MHRHMRTTEQSFRIPAATRVSQDRRYARALELDPNLFSAHLQMGILEQTAGNLPGALGRYERAAQLEPKNATVHYRLSGLYQKLGNQEKARAELEEFRRLKR